MIGRSDKCFSPWIGYLVILIVCIVIAGAVFFETKGSARKRARKHPKPVAQGTMHTVPATPVAGTTADGKVLF
ncbi:MAG: hypothetical protein WCO69_00515 [Candidatus Omnitrophota bacterium]